MMNKEGAIKENVCSESPWRAALNSLVSTPGGRHFNLQPSPTLCTALGSGPTFCVSFNKAEKPRVAHRQGEELKSPVK